MTHANSRLAKIESLEVGESHWFECDYKDSATIMRVATTVSRWPKHMKGRKYISGLFVCVAGSTNILRCVRIERIK